MHQIADGREAKAVARREAKAPWFESWLTAAMIAVALIAAMGSATLLQGMSAKRVARVDVVMVTSQAAKPNEQAALYDALGRGQVVATAASIFSQARWASDHPNVKLTAGSVAPSSVIQIQAVGPDEEEVRTVLMAAVRAATVQVDQILRPYSAQLLTRSGPQMSSAGLSSSIRIMLVVLATLAAAYATYLVGSRLRPDGQV